MRFYTWTAVVERTSGARESWHGVVKAGSIAVAQGKSAGNATRASRSQMKRGQGRIVRLAVTVLEGSKVPAKVEA